jgi:acyl-homoserine-lactone acylase
MPMLLAPHAAARFGRLLPPALAVTLALLAGCASAAVEPAQAPVETAETEILWDRYGIPHIFAPDLEGAVRGLGWAQARNHGDLLLRLYGESRGRAAEYWGEDRLESDRWVHTVGLPDHGDRAYAALEDSRRRPLDAFAEGVNAYAEAFPDSIQPESRRVLPVSGRDVHAQILAVAHLFSPAQPAAGQWMQARGSNAWAVAPSRSASGSAMLLTNPHLPWTESGYTFFEAHLVTPEMDSYGAALVGLPFLAIAFNDHLGWTHTVNYQRMETHYELVLAEGGYRFDGEVRPFEVDTVRLLVREEGEGHGLREESLVRRRSVHGPVVAATEERALAVRMVTVDWMPHMELMAARSLEEFEALLRDNLVLGFNTIYADAAGNIFFHHGGVTPRHGGGDFATWARPVPGDTSGYLWTDVHGYEEMPRVVNPAAGWIQNANEPPWYAADDPALDPAAYPAYIGAQGPPSARARQSIRLLTEPETLTFEEMIERKHAEEMDLAPRLVPGLVAAAKAEGSERIRAAAAVLAAWDGATRADSRGALLFEAWTQRYAAAAGPAFEAPWSPEDPLGTPRGLGDPATALAALEAAAAAVEARWGGLDVAWGDANRLRRDGVDLPASGGPGEQGIFRVIGFADPGEGPRIATFGDSYTAAVEFSDPIRARALTVYGNSSKAGSPHRTDQLVYFSRQELRPVWRTRTEIEANLRDRETP